MKRLALLGKASVSALLLVLTASFALAQMGGDYVLTRSVVYGGGGTGGSGSYVLSGVIGQPDVGVRAGGSYVLAGGFLAVGDTSSTAPGLLVGSVQFQGRGNPPGPRWVVSLTVTLHMPEVITPTYLFHPATDSSGQFTLTGVTPDVYDVRVRKAHTLTNKRTGPAIRSGDNFLDLGMLLEGDANENGVINSLDYAPLASAYLKSEGEDGFDRRVDFNGDGRINSFDYAPLASNYFKQSDVQ